MSYDETPGLSNNSSWDLALGISFEFWILDLGFGI